MAQAGMNATGTHCSRFSLLPFSRLEAVGEQSRPSGAPGGNHRNSLVHLHQADKAFRSVGVRMHWASKRQTTRVEDEAYCLMGLFDVSMATNYGEAAEAFVRLQHEIMRKTPDLSLFAFGGSLPFGDLSKHGYTLRPEATIFNGDEFLLASSPRRFRSAYNYTPNLGSNARQPYPPDPVSICLSFLLPRLNPLLNRTYQLP